MTYRLKDIDYKDYKNTNTFDCLRSVSLFSNLSEEDMICFYNSAHSHSYSKGKILYLEGDISECFYIISGGWVKLFHTMPDGEEIVLDMLTTGHMMGESAIFEQGKHTSSAEVVEAVQLISIPTKLLKEQIELNSTLAVSMLSSMFRHHRRHYSEMAFNTMQSAPQRIGCFLLRLCPNDNTNNTISFDLPYDKNLIAMTLGMKGATFSRALNILRQKTGIRINGDRVEMNSTKQLIEFVYGPLADKYLPESM